MEILMPIDVGSVVAVLTGIGATVLLLFAGLYIGFRLARKFITRAALSVGGESPMEEFNRIGTLKRAVAYTDGNWNPANPAQVSELFDALAAAGGPEEARKQVREYDRRTTRDF